MSKQLLATVVWTAACALCAARAAAADPPLPAAATPTDRPVAPDKPTPRAALTDAESTEAIGMRALDAGKLRLDLGGYFIGGGELRRDSAFNTDDYDGMSILAANFKAAGLWELSADWASRIQLDMDFSTGVFLSKNLFASLVFHDKRFAVDIGQMKVPFLLYEMTPEAVRSILPQPLLRKLGMGRDRGIRLRGEVPAGSTLLRWWAGAFHGEGPSVLRNVDNRYLYAGRAQWVLLGKLTDTESDLEGGGLRAAVGASAMYTPSLATRELGEDDLYLEELRWAADAVVKYKGFSARAEYIRGKVFAGELTNGFSRYGLWGNVAYVLPLGWPVRIEPVVRLTQHDFNSSQDGFLRQAGAPAVYGAYELSEQRRVDVGVNFYMVDRHLWLNLAWRTVKFLEGQLYDLDGKPLIGDQFTAYLHMGFP